MNDNGIKTRTKPGNVVDFGAAIAVVTEAADGIPLGLRCERTGENLAVSGRASALDSVYEGDRVLFLRLDGGRRAVAMLRLCRQGEGARANIEERDGRVRIEAANGLVLSCGGSRLELTADGRVMADGREVHQYARGRLALNSAVLEVN